MEYKHDADPGVSVSAFLLAKGKKLFKCKASHYVIFLVPTKVFLGSRKHIKPENFRLRRAEVTFQLQEFYLTYKLLRVRFFKGVSKSKDFSTFIDLFFKCNT